MSKFWRILAPKIAKLVKIKLEKKIKRKRKNALKKRKKKKKNNWFTFSIFWRETKLIWLFYFAPSICLHSTNVFSKLKLFICN